MAPRFLKMTRAEFKAAMEGFNWQQNKTEIHVHHTWRPNHAQYQGERSIIGMWEFHTRQGWSDIAQHVSIAPDGAIWTGRNWNKTPASARGHNHAGVFMFETIGDFDMGMDPLTGEQLESVLFVTAVIATRFGIANGKILFHNEVSEKTCPGSAVKKAQFLQQVVAHRNALADATQEEAVPSADARQLSEELNRRSEAEAAAPAEDLEAAEHSQDEALEVFMRTFHENVYSRRPSTDLGAETEAAPVRPSVRPESVQQQALSLSQIDDEALFRELGQRAYKLEALPESALSPGLQGDDTQGLEGLWDHFATLGRRIFNRVTDELYAVLCGTADDDASDRAKLRSAFKLGPDDVIAGLVGVLVGTFGIAGPIAAVIAALIAKRLLKPAYEETCKYWSEQIPRPAAG
jgi:hypothetical protein